MNFKQKFIYIFLSVFLIFQFFIITFTSFASTDTDNPNSASTGSEPATNSNSSNLRIYSPACILLDAKTGTVLYEKNANTAMYPASTTKLMTAILVLENCKLDDVATVSSNAVLTIPKSYSIADLQIGEQLTIEQLLHVLLIPSANDAANVLAEHVGGSVENFATMMNNKASEIGCTNTHFVNPNGVHNTEHVSTAHDLALIGKYALKFDVIKQIVLKNTYSLPSKVDGTERNFKCTNELIKESGKYYYEYATGLKTGYTNAAKSCIIASAKKENYELIVVILGGEKTEDYKNMRELDCKTLFEYGFNDCNLKELYEEYEKNLITENHPFSSNSSGNTSDVLGWIWKIALILLFFFIIRTINICNSKKRKSRKNSKNSKKSKNAKKVRNSRKRKRDDLYNFKLD